MNLERGFIMAAVIVIMAAVGLSYSPPDRSDDTQSQPEMIATDEPVDVHPDVQQPQVVYSERTGEAATIRFSRYDPALGGTNCAYFVDGVCRSNMASGNPWEPYMDRACACPAEWPFGTVVILDGAEWVCMDRGGGIHYESDGIPWVDFLTRTPAHSYGSFVDVQVIFE